MFRKDGTACNVAHEIEGFLFRGRDADYRVIPGDIKGEDLLGSDGESTVDSSHPNDLGFERQADNFAPVLKPLLKAR